MGYAESISTCQEGFERVGMGQRVVTIFAKTWWKRVEMDENRVLLNQKVCLPSFSSIQRHLPNLQNAKKEPPAGLEPAANRLRAEHSTD